MSMRAYLFICVSGVVMFGINCNTSSPDGPGRVQPPCADPTTCSEPPGNVPPGSVPDAGGDTGVTPPTDACRDVTCDGHGKCVENGGVAECSCEPGFVPDGHRCVASCTPSTSASVESVQAASSPLYPTPRVWEAGTSALTVRTVCMDPTELLSPEDRQSLLSLAVANGLVLGDSGKCTCDWTFQFDGRGAWLKGAAAATFQRASTNTERFAYATEVSTAGARTVVAAASARGVFYAISSALSATKPKGAGRQVSAATVVDYPTFRTRGFVEGTYGTAYTAKQRSVLLRSMGRLKMNTFVYGPKCDCNAGGANWRDSYATGAVKDVNPGCGNCDPCQPVSGDDIKAAIGEARANAIDFVWAVSPFQRSVLDFAKEGVAPITRKIDLMHAMGVRRFAVFIDDSDAVAGRGNPANAPTHASVVNQVNAHVKSIVPGSHVLMVGSGYAFGPDGYTDTLGKMLDADVEVMWTGPKIVPESLPADHFKTVNASFRRQVSLWDNWAWEAYFRGHPADLSPLLSGSYLNPVLSECTGHPTSTAKLWQILGPNADYVWNSERYAANAASEDASYKVWAARSETPP